MVSKSKIEKIYHLSPMQEGMLFHSIFNSDNYMYFEQFSFLIKGYIDIELFEKSFNVIIARHDVLRTIFVHEKLHTPQQIVLRERKAKIYYEDVSYLGYEQGLKYVEDFKKKDRDRGFELSKEMLVRLCIIKIDEDIYKLIWSFHHIIMDGWCIGIIIKEHLEVYKALLHGKSFDLPHPQSYDSFIKWIENREKEEALTYWQQYISGYEEEAVLPYNGILEGGYYDQKEHLITLDKETTQGLSKVASKNHVTLNTVFQAAWGILLQKYNNSNDVVFGSVVSGRSSEINDVENIVGLFINTVPVRIKCKSTQSFSQLLKDLQSSYFNSERNNYISLSDIQNKSVLKKHLLNHIIAFENYPIDKEILNMGSAEVTLRFKIEEVETFEQTNYNFNIVVIPSDELQIKFIYNTQVYDENTIKNIEGHLKQIIKSVIYNDNNAIKDIQILTPYERNKLLYQYNNSTCIYPGELPIYRLFEEQVEKTPENIAIEFENRKLTYRQLNDMANRLAWTLVKKGISTGDTVGIMIDRSIEMVASILGVIKAGAAYLPIDIEYPTDRVEYILKDSGAKILLSRAELANHIEFKNEILDVNLESTYSKDTSNLKNTSSPEDLAYIIYTSGTTGRPKGVMIFNRGLVNYICWAKNAYLGDELLDFPLYTSISFDLTVTSLFTPLIAGSKIVVYGEEDKISLIERIMEENKVGIVKLTPAHLRIIECFQNIRSNIKKFIVGGEDLKTDLAYKIHEKFKGEIQIFNEYGPTETVVGCMIHKYCPDEDKRASVPIGIPAGNAKVYVLDNNLEPVPEGCQGEMFISGDGVAKGYINLIHLTESKFLPNPFIANQRMYRTGDIARWIPGRLKLEYLGRIDHQVKIRGFRIELGEIESVLLSHVDITETLVMSGEDSNNNKYLCAYIITDRDLSVTEIRGYMLKVLPEYMIPSYFMRLDKFPMTPNGKIDRKALPKPKGDVNTGTEYIQPTDDIQEKLCQVWGEVLGTSKVGIMDNFFTLGGDSIKAIQVVSRLHKYNLKLEIKDLFQNPTVKEAALYTKIARRKSEQGIITGDIGLTPVQKWLFENNFTNNHHFNQSVMLYKKEGFNITTVKKCFEKILEHHDVLRTKYKKQDGEIVQYNSGIEGDLFDFEVFDFTDTDDYDMKIECEANRMQQNIDLINGPLLKLGLFKTSNGHHLLVIVHHLVIDGLSWRIISEDFATLYLQIENNRKIQLQEKTDSFKEWSKRLYEYSNSKKLLIEKEYWASIDSADLPKLPKDKEIKENRIKNSNDFKISLSEDTTAKLLKKVNHAYNTEINDILLSALGMAIKKWTGNCSILINLEGHGRESIGEDVSIERTVGWFTSMYPVVLEIPSEDNISLTIVSIKEILRRIPNKGIGYGILKYLTSNDNKKEMQFNLNPEISFNYMGQIDQDINTDIFSISKISTGMNLNPECQRLYDFDINAMIKYGKLDINFNYNMKQYEKGTVEKFAGYYKENLERIIEHCAKKENSQMTPSDFGDNALMMKELEEIYEMVGYDIEKIYSLSPMQEGMLFHSLMDRHSGAFFEQMTLYIKDNLDMSIMEKSISILIDRYETFRTVFVHEKINSPKQVVLKNIKPKFECIDISMMDYDSRVNYLNKYKENDRREGFDVSQGPLIKLTVFKCLPGSYTLVWSFHHIIMDGWCMGIIINDLFRCYSSILKNEEIKLERIQPYSKYIEWLAAQDKQEAHKFWESYLKGFEDATLMECMENSNTAGNYVALEKEYNLDEELTRDLKDLAKSRNITLNTVVQTIWGIILGKFNNSEDCVFGSVVSGRPSEIEGIETMVGLFINTIPVRVKCTRNKSFEELAKEVQQESVVATKYQHIPVNEISAIAGKRKKLIDHVIIFENYPIEKEISRTEAAEGLRFKVEGAEMFEQSNYNFNIMVTPDNTLNFKYLYNGNAYNDNILSLITGYFEEAARKIVQNPGIKVKEVDMLSSSQKENIITKFKGQDVEIETDKHIYKFIENHAANVPERIAVSYGTEHYTYRQINERANRMARFLKEKGFGIGDIAVIMLQRSPLLLEWILAVWKAGGAYIPVDITYPTERIFNILNSSEAKILLTKQEYISLEADNYLPTTIVDIDFYEGEISSQSVENLDINISISDIAYVIYTSGSTGKPKGAMVEHIGMYNHINAKINDLNITTDSVIVQNASQCFDISVWQFFAALVAGGRTVIYPTELCMDVESFVHRIGEDGVTILEVVPSFLSAVLEYLKSKHKEFNKLKYLLVTGETVKANLVKKWFELYPQIKMVNAYGPTEASDDITHFIMDKALDCESIPIGKPIQNFNIYIVDNDMNLCPIGIKGEICVSGIGVGRGYLNDKEKTKAVFMEDPFAKQKGIRLYKTGDLGRWLPDGNIEFFGRKDYQVKIRGYRIELGEIESVLSLNEGIKECVVDAVEDFAGNKKLVAYITLETEVEAAAEVAAGRDEKPTMDDEEIYGDLDYGNNLQVKLIKGFIQEQVDFIKSRLPEYMVPANFIVLKKIPLTPNGKVDRKALPKPNLKDICEEYIAPRNETERKLQKIWMDLLNIKRVGINDNFFDIGGDSIKVIKLVSQIQQQFDVKIHLKEVFNNSTIEKMTECIASAHISKFESIKSAVKKEYYKVSSAQKRLFILSQIDDEGISYNIPTAVMIEGAVNKFSMEKALNQLIRRHETLRTSFVIKDNEPVQIIHEDIQFTLEYEEIEHQKDNDMLGTFVRRFDLSSAPLLRAKLIKIHDLKYILLFDIHHIISDAISISILIREFISLYQGMHIPPLNLQYKDFAEWQSEFLKTDDINQQEKYWLEVFSSGIPELNLSTDFPRVSMNKHRGDNVKVELSDELIEKLSDISGDTGATLFMILMSAFNILLSKYSGKEDIVVGVPVSGRDRADLQNIIGMFINTVAMRNQPCNSVSYREFLKQVKENAINAFENQDYQFDALVEKLNIKREPGMNPIFNVMFDMYEVEFPELKVGDLMFKQHGEEYEIARFDFTLFAHQINGGVRLSIRYSTELYRKSTIETMLKHYVEILEKITENLDVKLADIRLSNELAEADTSGMDKNIDFCF